MNRARAVGSTYWVDVNPLELYVFQVVLGSGCEPAVFGLARYPEYAGVEGQTRAGA
ncbi:MAG: hypothetical protein AB1816_00645 [Bacillota bacterium]